MQATMPDGSLYRINRLLSKSSSNAKLAKSDKADKGIVTVGLSLVPHKLSGFNLCTSASHACVIDCLNTAGVATIWPEMIHRARVAKSRLFKMDKEIFVTNLMAELNSAYRSANRKGFKLYCRLNVLSDVMWEREVPEIFTNNSGILFYDYTKHYLRMLRYINGEFPANTHLTFSWSGTNRDKCVDVLTKGGNVAVPFNVKYHQGKYDPLPKKFMGFKVIDGDQTDLRPLDPKPRKGNSGYIVGLRAKGRAKKDTASGFVVQMSDPGVKL